MNKFVLRFTSLLGVHFCFISIILAQYPDNNWLLGYTYTDSINNGFGLVQLNFDKNQISIGEETELLYRLGHHNSVISDREGKEILFFFNGLQVREGDYDLAVNGDDMYIGMQSLGYESAQASLILPYPESDNRYILLNTYTEYNLTLSTTTGYELNYSIIEVDENGIATVLEKNELIETGDLSYGQLTATRHANGRDWWIIWPYWDSNRYMRFLFTPTGLERYTDIVLTQTIESGPGRACFSPDGRFFAMYNGISSREGDFIDVYEFDRCTGELSNHRQLNIESSGIGGGAAIAPNSRYLYVSSTLYLLQFDLYAEDIFGSIDTVAIYDGGLDPFPTTFNQVQLARDGKIYMSATSGMRKLHVIDYPNRRGVACNVRQRGVELPVYTSFGLPNFPYHRLGPLDGSPCDTLGIDNVPLASFRSDQDSSDYLSFFFQNLSDYEPTHWQWSFGDGSISQDTSPVHTYAQDGVYEVCLTVSNEYGANTSCDTLYLGVVNSTEATAPKVAWQLFPNPAREYFTFNLLDYYPKEAYLELYNSMGQRVRRERVFAGWNTVEIGELPSGVYSFVVVDPPPSPLPSMEGGLRLASGKVVKVE